MNNCRKDINMYIIWKIKQNFTYILSGEQSMNKLLESIFLNINYTGTDIENLDSMIIKNKLKEEELYQKYHGLFNFELIDNYVIKYKQI